MTTTLSEERLAAPMTMARPWERRSEKIQSWQRDRLALVYVRQSTPRQVRDHQESTRLQYGLTSRAHDLGWAEARVVVIDDDLGKSGASADGRPGFQRLVTEVSLGHVGIILGVEMSRLARSGKDWHQLLELCALFRTLIADLDGVYDPAEYSPEPAEGPAVAGAEGDDERGGAAYPEAADVPGTVEQGPTG